MLSDLKHAFRVILQGRWWTAVVLISLSLGIGANTALFSAVNGVLIQTVAVPDPSTLVRLKWAGKNDMVRSSSDYGSSLQFQGQNVRSTFSFATFQQLRAANTTLTDLFGCAPIGSFNVVVNGEAEIVSGLGVTGNYFRVLRVAPAIGRMLSEDDDKPGAPAVAVISNGYWRRRFGSDPNISGRVISVNNQPITIVGVAPVGFLGIQRLGNSGSEVTVPIALDSQLNVGQTRITQPTNWWVQLVGRLKPGVTVDQARGNFEGVFQQNAREGMALYQSSLTAEQRGLSTNQQRGTAMPQLLVQPAARGIYDVDLDTRRTVNILGAVVTVVLLIVCANVANLLLSRATSRRKEISVRLSMGATRGRLIRQLLVESVLLSSIGGVLGIAVGYWSRELLPFGQTAAIDWRVYAFTAGISTLTGVVFGLVPAFRATRVDLATAMKENSRSVTTTRGFLSKGLLVLQVALSLVLLVGAGLFLRTLHNLRAVGVGFNTSNLLMFNVNPQLNRYDADRTATLYRQMNEGLRNLPGVRSVAMTRVILLSGSTSTSSVHVPERAGDNNIYMMTVSPEFFATLEIPVTLGRNFVAQDSQTSPKVAVLNETAARQLFPDTSAVGKRLGFSLEKNTEFEVVGVVRDTKYNSLRDAAPPTLYQSYLQSTPRSMSFALRTAGDPSQLTDQVRAAVRGIDANLPLTNITTQSEQLEGRFARERLFANAFTAFGALAMIIACTGLFGLMSYNVGRRTNEIGIRMALGAQRFEVARMILSESTILVGVGIGIGLGITWFARRFVASSLFGLEPTDIVTIAVSIALIVIVSTLAGYLPARRAARVDPMVALHQE